MEAVEDDIGGQPVEPLGGALDLGDAGQEGEDSALRLVGQRCADRGGHRILDALAGIAAEMAQRDRMAAARALARGACTLPSVG